MIPTTTDRHIKMILAQIKFRPYTQTFREIRFERKEQLAINSVRAADEPHQNEIRLALDRRAC